MDASNELPSGFESSSDVCSVRWSDDLGTDESIYINLSRSARHIRAALKVSGDS